MPNANQTEIVTVLGQSGSGKSSWIEKQLPCISRFILWDTLGEYSFGVRVESQDALYHSVYKNFKRFFGMTFAYSGKAEEGAFDWTVRLCLSTGNLTFICDEVDQYATPTEIPDSLRIMLKRGRHLNINMIFASRRPAEVNRLITAQSRRFILFRTTEPADIRFLKSIVGVSADELKDLPPLHFLDWNHGEITRGKIDWEKGGDKHAHREKRFRNISEGTSGPD